MKSKQNFTRRLLATTLILSTCLFTTAPHTPVASAAGDGTIDSIVEINSTTPNGPSLSNGDWLGSSVTKIGDLNNDGIDDLAAGAYFDTGGGSFRGAVHIMFMNTDGSIDSTVEINDSTPNGPTLANSDLFGSSVTAIGDLNGDGVIDLAVGARGHDHGGISNTGAIYIIFMNTDGSVDSTVRITRETLNGPDLGGGDFFGTSIANLGDLNGDGVTDIASGAMYDAGGGFDRGAVHIMFMNTDGTIDSTVEINDTTPNGPVLLDEDNFGSSLANIGDLNGDGVIDLAVGASLDDAGGDDRGAVHIMFMNTDGSIDSTVEINDTTPNGPTLADYDKFGRSVADIGDLNGDGVNDIAAGAPYHSGSETETGELHIMFMNTDGSVESTVTINEESTNGPTLLEEHQFGFSVAGIGDLNNDDVLDIAVGASTFSGIGTVYLLFMQGENPPAGGGGRSLRLDNPHAPSVSVTNITEDSARARLSFSAQGIITTEIGMTLNTAENEVKYSKSWNVSNPSQMSAVNQISNLTCNTTYSLLAYAKNSQSTTYAEPTIITTTSCEDGLSPEPPIQITPTPTPLDTPLTTPTPALFPVRDLYYNLFGQDVAMLQRLLNNNGFTLAQSGPGSPGQETNFFGSLTRSALAKLQATHSIFPTAGYFGSITRSVLKTMNLPGIWW